MTTPLGVTAVSLHAYNITSPPDVDEKLGWAVSRIENSLLVRTIYGLIAVLGMTGNALVCFVLLRVPSLRTRTSQFIIHLAVTDFMTSFWVVPFHLFPVVPAVPRGFAGELMCRFYVSKYLFWVTVFASVYSLVAVTLERYFAIVHPIKYRVTFSLRYSVLIMIGCWIVGAVSNSFFFYVYDLENDICKFVPYPTVSLQKMIGVYIFTLIYFLPSAINLVCHAKMIRALRRQAGTLRGDIGEGQNRNYHHGNKQKEAWQLKVAQDVQHMLLVVVITFLVCWAPNQFIFLAFNLGADVDFASPIYHFSVILAICNSCMNPFIYVFKNRDFRIGLLTSLGCSRIAVRLSNSVRPAPAGNQGADGRGEAAAVVAVGGGLEAGGIQSEGVSGGSQERGTSVTGTKA